MFLHLSHTKTPVFQESQNLALECYRITKLFPSDEKFAMVQQIRRAALSVHLNIAEGCSRKSIAERKRYYEIARGSVIEIDAAIGLAFKLQYCDLKAIEHLGSLIVSCFKQLTAMIGSGGKDS
jgi:four helix bundle protein